MKKLFSLVAIVCIVFASNCSRIPENNDPVIGIWTNVETKTISQTQKQSIRHEWIFNDAYLGRFHRIENGAITIKTDFQWKQKDGEYILSYPGIDRADDTVVIKTSEDQIRLELIDGHIFANRN